MKKKKIIFSSSGGYKDCLTSKKAEYLIDVKRGCHTLEEARQIAKSTLDDTIRRKNEYMESNPLAINKFVEELMNEVLISVLKKSFVLELGV